MKDNIAILFDFDGVIADTEPIYDKYVDELGDKYNLGVENFAAKVKGTPTPDILKKYFGHLDEKAVKDIGDEILNFELSMDIPPITGAIEFIRYLKDNSYPIGLVTSSQMAKMERALKLLNLENSFDTIVTADRIIKGKPDPMCFILAAKDLNIEPEKCLVFEDSIHGINAAHSANMRVIGVTTSYTKEEMPNKVCDTISDFSDLNKVLSLILKKN